MEPLPPMVRASIWYNIATQLDALLDGGFHALFGARHALLGDGHEPFGKVVRKEIV